MEMETEEAPAEENPPLQNKQEELVNENPIGEVILGTEDPRLMTREDFGNSPDILFHGTSNNFMFSRDFDYDSKDTPFNSWTVGCGFYATKKVEDAKLFGEAFAGGKDSRPIVAEILPYQAKMYDFRIGGTNANAPVPKDILDGYTDWAEKQIAQKIKRTEGQLNYNIKNSYLEYYDTINAIKNSGKLPDLRSMLSRKGDRDNVQGPGTLLFPQYMKEIGYDGIIYTEGGDHPQHKDPVSYVFYNLDKVGTYTTWHEDELRKNESFGRETVTSITSS